MDHNELTEGFYMGDTGDALLVAADDRSDTLTPSTRTLCLGLRPFQLLLPQSSIGRIHYFSSAFPYHSLNSEGG